MGDFKYKQYTEEEDKIHDEAVARIREAMSNGMSFNEACGVINIEDSELKEFILDDALKIMIAELHYVKGMPLPQVADVLKVPIKQIASANMEMMEDVGNSAAELHRRTSTQGPVGHA